MSASRRLYAPRPVEVRAATGVPLAVAGVRGRGGARGVGVEDRWWTPRPLRRRYFELVLADGRDTVVFHSEGGRWYRQRA